MRWMAGLIPFLLMISYSTLGCLCNDEYATFLVLFRTPEDGFLHHFNRFCGSNPRVNASPRNSGTLIQSGSENSSKAYSLTPVIEGWNFDSRDCRRDFCSCIIVSILFDPSEGMSNYVEIASLGIGSSCLVEIEIFAWCLAFTSEYTTCSPKETDVTFFVHGIKREPILGTSIFFLVHVT